MDGNDSDKKVCLMNNQRTYYMSLQQAINSVEEHADSTETTFAILKSDPDFGKTAWQTSEFNIKWSEDKSAVGEPLLFDAVPFLLLGTRILGCQHIDDKEDASHKRGKKRDAKGNTCAKKQNKCPAKIILKEVVKFPDYKIQANTKTEMKKWSRILRNDLKNSATVMQPRIYVDFPKPEDHAHTPEKENEDDSESSKNCLVCNANITSATKSTVPIFSDKSKTSHRQLHVSIVLSEVLDQDLNTQKLHSTTMCSRCFSLLDAIDGLEDQLAIKKQVMAQNYLRTTKLIRGCPEEADNMEDVIKDNDDQNVISGKKPRTKSARRGHSIGKTKEEGSGLPLGKSKATSPERTPEERDAISPKKSLEKRTNTSTQKSAVVSSDTSPKKSAKKRSDTNTIKSAEKCSDTSPQKSAKKRSDTSPQKSAEKSSDTSLQKSAKKRSDTGPQKSTEKSSDTSPQKSTEKNSDTSPKKSAKKRISISIPEKSSVTRFLNARVKKITQLLKYAGESQSSSSQPNTEKENITTFRRVYGPLTVTKTTSTEATPTKTVVKVEPPEDDGETLPVSIQADKNLTTFIKLENEGDTIDSPFLYKDTDEEDSIIAVADDDDMEDQISVEIKGDMLEVEEEPIEPSENQKYMVECEECDQTFSSFLSLKNHFRVHSRAKRSTEKSHKCHICDKKYYFEKSLNTHIRNTHTMKPPQKVFVCDICGKSLSCQQTLTHHQLTHSGERPFQCELCGATFRQRGNMLFHIKVKHLQERDHVCKICQKSFTRKRLLVCHINSIHKGERPYKCEVCGASFVYPNHYNIHLRKHNESRVFKCHICSKQFSTQAYCNQHLFLHSNIRQYECKICGAGFMRKPLCVAHVASHAYADSPESNIIYNSPREMVNAFEAPMSEESIELIDD